MRSRLLVDAIPPSLTTAVGISVVSHLAVHGLTPVVSLHMVAARHRVRPGAAPHLVLRPLSGAMIVCRFAISRMADRVGRGQLLMPARGLLAAGFGALIAQPTAARLALAAAPAARAGLRCAGLGDWGRDGLGTGAQG